MVLFSLHHLWKYIGETQKVALFSQPRSTCTESPVGNITRREARYRNHPLSFEGPGRIPDNQSLAAVCEFKIFQHTDHFPHAMQQIYQCWSYWNLPRNRGNKKKVLVWPNDDARGFRKAALRANQLLKKVSGKDYLFVGGMLTALEEAANVTITSDANLGRPVSRGDRANTFFMESPEDARLLAQTIASYYNLSSQAGCNWNNPTALPRVGILNREKRSSRSILNVDLLQQEIQHVTNVETIEIAYFETASFLQQVNFFANVDILISPHGAQLTALPFMPRCGRILELFPKFYYFDDFFGSLAEAAGLEQYALYLADSDPATDNLYSSTLTSVQRRKHRNVNLCPPLGVILEATKQMVADWKECCHSS